MDFDPNWPGVAEWVEITVPAYNRLVNALCAIADPQAIVFGGQIPARLAQMLIERAANAIERVHKRSGISC